MSWKILFIMFIILKGFSVKRNSRKPLQMLKGIKVD